MQRWTVHLVSYTFCRWQYVFLHSFSRCWLQNLRNHATFRAVRGRSRSSTLFKVIELDRLDANRKSRPIICNFLLIINSDCDILILYFFEISTHRAIENSSFPSPPLFDAPAQGNPPEFLNETYALCRKNWRYTARWNLHRPNLHQPFLIDPPVWQMDGQMGTIGRTGGRSTKQRGWSRSADFVVCL